MILFKFDFNLILNLSLSKSDITNRHEEVVASYSDIYSY